LALQRNIPLGLLTQIAAKANAARTPRPRHWGQRPKPEDLAYNRFATAETPYDAIQMALEDPEVQEAVLGQRLGGRIGGKNPRITMAEIRAGAEWIAVPGGLDVARADQRHSEEGRRAIVDQAGAKSVELQKEANAELNREEAKYTEWVKLVKRTNAPWRRPGIGMVAETAWALRGDYSSAAGDVGYFVGMDREAATANFEHFAGLATETSRQRWRERLPRANWGIPDPIHDRKEAQVDRMLEDPQMTEQTELLREVLSARGSDFDLALATFMQSIAGE
jgi:hypothetical protein